MAQFKIQNSKFKILLLVWLLAACTAGNGSPLATPSPTPDRYLETADALAAEHRYTEAVEVLEAAAARHSDSAVPLVAVGQIYLLQRRWLLAEDAFNRALARQPDYPAASAGLAEAYLGQGRDQDALRQWQILTATHPDWPGVFTGLGRVRLRQLAFDEARRAFLAQQAHSFDPEAEWYLAVLDSAVDLPRARARLEGLASRTDLPPELAARLDYLQDTLEALPAEASTATAARQVGIAMVQAQKWSLAVYALEAARQSAAPDGELLAFLGYARAKAGAPALALFEQARQADPRSSLPLYFEGIYLREQNALKAAEDRLAQAIALDPENAALFLEYARVREAMGDLATAEAAHLKAVELAGDDTAFRLALVDFYARHSYRVREAAIPAARALVEAEPDNAEAYSLLGWLELLNGQSTAAEKTLRRALELDPELVSARYHLGRLLEAVGQAELARREYQHVVDWDFAGIYRDDALKALQRLNR